MKCEGTPIARNHLLRRPNTAAKSPPDTRTDRFVPSTRTPVTRPPQSPLPSRPVARTPRKRPIDGHVAWMSCAVISCAHTWNGDAAWPGSETARKYGAPPFSVVPPVDDEYSARIGWRRQVMMRRAVARTAAVERGDSNHVQCSRAFIRRAAPPYT